MEPKRKDIRKLALDYFQSRGNQWASVADVSKGVLANISSVNSHLKELSRTTSRRLEAVYDVRIEKGPSGNMRAEYRLRRNDQGEGS